MTKKAKKNRQQNNNLTKQLNNETDINIFLSLQKLLQEKEQIENALKINMDSFVYKKIQTDSELCTLLPTEPNTEPYYSGDKPSLIAIIKENCVFPIVVYLFMYIFPLIHIFIIKSYPNLIVGVIVELAVFLFFEHTFGLFYILFYSLKQYLSALEKYKKNDNYLKNDYPKLLEEYKYEMIQYNNTREEKIQFYKLQYKNMIESLNTQLKNTNYKINSYKSILGDNYTLIIYTPGLLDLIIQHYKSNPASTIDEAINNIKVALEAEEAYRQKYRLCFSCCHYSSGDCYYQLTPSGSVCSAYSRKYRKAYR